MVSVVFVVGVSVPAVGGRGGKRGVKRGPPLPAGVEAPWDGGKRNMKPRPPLLRRKRRLWTFLVRPGRPRFQPAPKTARHGWSGFQPTPKTARQGWPGFQPTPLEQRSGRAGPTQRPHSPAWSAARPAITPWTHHPACLLPFRLIARWHRVDEVSHSPGMRTPFTPHGAARSCSRRVEVLRLARLLDTPAGSLRLTHRKTVGRVCPRRVGSIHLVTNARTPTRAPPLDAPVDDRKHAHGRLRFQ